MQGQLKNYGSENTEKSEENHIIIHRHLILDLKTVYLLLQNKARELRNLVNRDLPRTCDDFDVDRSFIGYTWGLMNNGNS